MKNAAKNTAKAKIFNIFFPFIAAITICLAIALFLLGEILLKGNAIGAAIFATITLVILGFGVKQVVNRVEKEINKLTNKAADYTVTKTTTILKNKVPTLFDKNVRNIQSNFAPEVFNAFMNVNKNYETLNSRDKHNFDELIEYFNKGLKNYNSVNYTANSAEQIQAKIDFKELINTLSKAILQLNENVSEDSSMNVRKYNSYINAKYKL